MFRFGLWISGHVWRTVTAYRAMASTQKTLHTCPITLAQAEKLRALLEDRGWEFAERPYTLYFAQKDKLTRAVYEKGPKDVVQGRGTEEFVQFTLEPEVLGVGKLGYGAGRKRGTVYTPL